MQSRGNNANPGAGRILAPVQLKAWRANAGRAKKKVAVITGSFDILQPGNLALARAARRQADRVCAVIEPDDHPKDRGWAWNPLETRLEFAAFLRDIDAVTPFMGERRLRQLSPFTLVDCLAQSASDAVQRAARATAQSFVDLPPVAGCFTWDISRTLSAGLTPVAIPEKYRAPQPTPADLECFLAGRAGKTVVTINGCFDILHIGHLRLFAWARARGDCLIVLVNDDAYVRAHKGPARPVFPLAFRLDALRALRTVSLAYPFSGDNPLEALAVIRPRIHVKGGTFEASRVRQERELVASWGGRLEFFPLVKGYSTTNLHNHLKNGPTPRGALNNRRRSRH